MLPKALTLVNLLNLARKRRSIGLGPTLDREGYVLIFIRRTSMTEL